jgi:hypothetical protein
MALAFPAALWPYKTADRMMAATMIAMQTRLDLASHCVAAGLPIKAYALHGSSVQMN